MPKKLTTEEFIQKAIKIHGDKYDYSLVDYVGCKNKIKIICKIHGEFLQRPDAHLEGKNCTKCSSSHIPKSNDAFIKEANLVHNNKYDYSLIDYKRNDIKIKIICPLHGEFEQQPNSHLNGRGCKKCYKESKLSNTLEFIDKSNKIHNYKYTYNNVVYINAIKKVSITCKIHGDFLQIPNSHLNGRGCPICNNSIGESIIFNWLTNNNIDFISQYKIKMNQICKNTNIIYTDFIINFKNKIYIIEYDGIQHFELVPYFHKNGIDDLNKQINRDNILIEYCINNNIDLIRIKYNLSHEEIINKLKENFEK